MFKFLKKILIFGIIFFIFDKVFLFFIYKSPSLEVDNRLEKIINGDLNKDLIVMGSSRGARNIIAKQIEDSLKIPAYNLSYPGSDIEFHEFLLRSLIKFNKKPKVILLAVDDPAELLPSESINFRFDRLYPLVKHDYIIDEMISKGKKNIFSYAFALGRINTTNFDLKIKRFSELDTIIECGSMPISFQRKDRDFIYFENNSDYDTKKESKVKLSYFNQFIESCKYNNIKLYFVFSPNFVQCNEKFENRMKSLSGNVAHFIHYDTSKAIYKNKFYYYDEAHLKKNGAEIFTYEIIEKLKHLNLKKINQ